MKDYAKMKKQMRQLVRMVKEVIEEVEKDTPDNVLLCDISEEMEELFEQFSATILDSNAIADDIYARL